MDRPYLSLVVPAYNEEGRLPATIEKLRAFLKRPPFPYEVLVVDDGSTDGTAALVEKSIPSLPELRLLKEPHRGKGHAVRQGMLAARGQYIMFCDADFSMPVEETPNFPTAISESCQVAIGSREVKGARRIGEPRYRHLMGRVFNLLVRVLTMPDLQDTQCGFKCFSRKAAKDIFGRQVIDGFGFDVEVLYLARKLGYGITEVPVSWYYSPSSRVDPVRDTLRMIGDVLRVRSNDRNGLYDTPPQPRENPETVID
ncbi:MAG TPA: dolichyl-phosphate beta-glucosyltransferase [Chloroflexota bacterium]|nr:dolichyl-phosphate beta-glucosyltransferase [Chloroflexota bacterium]